MNNGQTRESLHQIAVIEDEDVEIFVAFCEYAYSGNYSVPPPGMRQEDRERESIENPFRGMFSEDVVGGVIPAAGLMRSSRKSVKLAVDALQAAHGGDGNEDIDDGRGEEDAGDASQQPPRAGQAWYLSTTTEYPPQDPTITPRESIRSATPSTELSSSRGRRRHRDKGKQRLIRDPASKLTPPRTPPGNALAGSAEQWVAESAEEAHALDAEPGTEADQPATQPNTWGHPPLSFENGPTEDHQYGPHTHQRDEGLSRSRARPVIDTSFANQKFSPRHEKGTSLWDEFRGIDDAKFHSPVSGTRPSHSLPGFGLPYLIFHAKLYVFATRYLIPDLAHLCLHKLHRDLLNLGFPDPDPESQYAEQFVLTTTKARMIVDLLSYTYTKTTRLEPITPSSATQLRDNELRRLVVHYAACKVRDLAEYCPPTEPIAGSPFYPEKPSARGFRALLDTLPELASDLIYRMI
ncbi:uncharacterized protein BJX67DRAFT_302517 [Aspergillus lucknowensis]|uniref:BTB domain-containing protein n=1 Tax=Aspergillus lucknowensis TaxID=176173 RepID=A0ABR4LZL5_9EURO